MAALLFIGLSSCEKDDDNNDDNTAKSITELASENSDLSSLVAALEASGLDATLDASGTYTVFAPTNVAFQDLLDSNSAWNSLADIDIATLEAVLTYYVVASANVQSSQLTDNQVITTFNGADLTVDLSSGAKLETTSAQSVNIIIENVQGTNGVIHAIDAVLLP